MSLPGSGFSSLPASHLTPTTLLGAGGEDRETVGQLYAAQLASHLSLKDPDEKRTLLLGLGLKDVDTARGAFFDVLELVQQVL
jgi:proteasome assembly chaperone 3